MSGNAGHRYSSPACATGFTHSDDSSLHPLSALGGGEGWVEWGPHALGTWPAGLRRDYRSRVSPPSAYPTPLASRRHDTPPSPTAHASARYRTARSNTATSTTISPSKHPRNFPG